MSPPQCSPPRLHLDSAVRSQRGIHPILQQDEPSTTDGSHRPRTRNLTDPATMHNSRALTGRTMTHHHTSTHVSSCSTALHRISFSATPKRLQHARDSHVNPSSPNSPITNPARLSRGGLFSSRRNFNPVPYISRTHDYSNVTFKKASRCRLLHIAHCLFR